MNRGTHRAGCGFWALAALLCAAPACCADIETADESEIKATMIYNLAKFVEWPAWKAGDPHAPLVLGIWGWGRLGQDLENLVREKKAGARPVVVRRLSGPADAQECHMVFVSRGEYKAFAEAAPNLAKSAVLTVGDSDGFANERGVVGLVLKGNRIQMEVNLAAAQRSGVNISSRLLKLVNLVGEPNR